MNLLPPSLFPFAQQVKGGDGGQGIQIGRSQRLAQLLGRIEEKLKLGNVRFFWRVKVAGQPPHGEPIILTVTAGCAEAPGLARPPAGQRESHRNDPFPLQRCDAERSPDPPIRAPRH